MIEIGQGPPPPYSAAPTQGHADAPAFRRKPIPHDHDEAGGGGPHPKPGLRPDYGRGLQSSHAPRPLRFVRSTTDLTPGAGAPTAHARPPPLSVGTALVAPGQPVTSPVNFIVDSSSFTPTPTPTTPTSLSVPTSGQQQVRRVKSSSALSAGTTGSAPDYHDAARPKTPSRLKSAMDEAQYFATGLISHPVESTRHFSVIRHCNALVWYRGPSTSVAITVLSDQPLPADRTLWLQDKGYSGNVGMAVKALVGTKGGWLDVTPATRAAPEHLPEAEERGMQRDMRRFEKKASGRQKGHVARETHVVRIPAAAADGYFRLVVCAGEGGKKTLCGSPVFRIASTSTDAAVVRGASLSTMPLELGVKVATTVGQRVARTYAGVAGAVVENRARKLVPTEAIRRAGATALRGYQTSGVGAAVDERWQNNKRVNYDPLVAGAMLDEPLTVIGSDEGPEAPFPLKFEGKVVQGSGRSAAELGIPTANLSDVPDVIKMRLSGVFAAWVRVGPKKSPEDPSPEWYEAIATIAPLRTAAPGIVMRNAVVVHIIHGFEGADIRGARLKVLLMGYLRPAAAAVGAGAGSDADPDPDPQLAVLEHDRDVIATVASLARPAWAAEGTLARLRGARSERSLSDRLDEATGKVAHQVGRIPLHWAGVRSEAGAIRDQAYGKGGMWIPR
ncbi:Riboflavin kinase [Paramyrothecium foliicola]|nr:Riboflavin kinase [Paramyrothecium foliicola]